jgi:hypothetical protein
VIDGIADVRSKLRELYGDKVKLRIIPAGGGGLLGRLRRLPSIAGDGDGVRMMIGDELLSTLETRSLWSRYGL